MAKVRRPQMFPTHFKIILEQREPFALDDLCDREPWWREPIELLHAALRKGIAAMKKEERGNRDPHQPTRVQLEAIAATADGQTLATVPNRGVEPYVATPVSERTRQRLEDALSETDLGEEELYEALLNLGLDAIEDNASKIASAPKRRLAMRVANQTRWRALCGRVASGWR